uniref:Uncharacterized protein n=1 Tax=Pristionchus pacificus TaxID=54126 RepID=A0A8R1YVT5_PRIPA
MKCPFLLLFIFNFLLISSVALECDVPESIFVPIDPRLKNLRDSFITFSEYLDVPYLWSESWNTVRVLNNCVADLLNFSRSTIQLIWRNYKEDQVLYSNPKLNSLRDNI